MKDRSRGSCEVRQLWLMSLKGGGVVGGGGGGGAEVDEVREKRVGVDVFRDGSKYGCKVRELWVMFS